jgi:aryl-phospho-beta-D-glucosidase BglC (GH1 family)
MILSAPKVQHEMSPSAPHTPTVNAQQYALHVVGNQLVNANGRPVTLHGVTRDGSDFLCAENKGIFDGPTGTGSIAALLSWHINAVRMPLNEACWLGFAGISPQYGGAAYQNSIAAYTQALTAAGIYVILGLHKNAPGQTINTHTIMPAPDEDNSVRFWQQVATTFQGNRMVLFDLYNEPHDVSWACWRSGGTCKGVSYQVAGMQQLVQTVRSTGAKNVLLAAADDWANDIGQWLQYAPIDPLQNLAAAWHVYMEGGDTCADVACYNREATPVIAQVPLVVTEFGADSYGVSCNPSFQQDVTALLDWMDQRAGSYMAFSWNVGAQTCGSLSLIADWHGTPHAPNGTAYQARLLGTPRQSER